MQYKQRLKRTEQQQLAISLNDLLRRTDNGSSPRQQRDYRRLLKTAQRYRAAQTDRAMTDDVMDALFDQGLLL
jgi:hypothetical protein